MNQRKNEVTEGLNCLSLYHSLLNPQRIYKYVCIFVIMELVALISTGKGSWGLINSLINKEEWDKIILVGEEYAKKFSPNKKSEFVVINFNQDVEKVKKEIMEKLRSKLQGIEVALCIDSGSGKEHIALISALINIPVGIKFVTLTEKGALYI